MKIILLKDWKNPAGRVIEKGNWFTVTNDKGREMIKEGIAKEYKPGLISKFKKRSDEEPEDGDKGK